MMLINSTKLSSRRLVIEACLDVKLVTKINLQASTSHSILPPPANDQSNCFFILFKAKYGNSSKNLQILNIYTSFYHPKCVHATCKDPYLNNRLIKNHHRTRIYRNFFHNWLCKPRVRPTPEKKSSFICFNESPLKMMKNAFHFI